MTACRTPQHSRFVSRAPVRVLPENEEDIVRRLPVESLRLSKDTTAKLRSLDLRTVGQVLALPRQSLPARFGADLLKRLDQLFGRQPETILPQRRPDPVEASWEGEHPLRNQEGLDRVATELLRTIRDELHRHGTGFQQVVCLLTGVNGQAARLTLELLRPTTDVVHVLDLFRLQWERLSCGVQHAVTQPFGEGLTRIHMQSVIAMPVPAHQQSLIDAEADQLAQRHLDLLIERLSSRLGRGAVLRPTLVAEAVPERAYEFVPCLDSRTAMPREADEPRAVGCLQRPVWLKATPAPVAVLSVVPDGPPYEIHWQNQTQSIAHVWGPERITAGWWNGVHVRRDYYHVETDSGRRCWLYRDLGNQRWYLHAEFD